MAAQYGCFVFIGKSGRVYYKDAYHTDSAGAKVRLDSGSGASSSSAEDISFPEAVALIDVAIAAATGQTKTQLLINETPTGDICRNSLHLVSVTNRPSLGLPISTGARFSAVQLA